MNQVATIEIELLSEAIFAGDGEQRGNVDIDLRADEDGFPYYAGRTLKGILREQAEWYIDCINDERKRIELREAFYRLFGQADNYEQDIHHSNHTSLRFSDAKLSHTLYEFVQKNNVEPLDVFRSTTAIRSMTKIDDETGTAESGNLRQVRVIHKGYKFYAPIYVQGELNSTEKFLLETAVKLVRHIGLMRNRGKGHVKCSIHWYDKTQQAVVKEKLEKSKSSGKYFILTIHVHEPLKINHVLGTSDSSQALNYIPGYVLRGALVQAYLLERGLSPNDLDTQVIFDHRKIQFWNGYLQINNQRGLPFAQHLFETKDQAKKSYIEQGREVLNSLEEGVLEKNGKFSPVRINRDVMLLTDDQVFFAKNVKKVSSLHINVNGNRGKEKEVNSKTLIYRYEAIAPQQIFQAVVVAKTEHPFVSWLQEKNELSLWLGGARNSGYGRVTVELDRTDVSPEQPGHCFEMNREIKELYIMATSDWIIRNQLGQLVGTLDNDWLNEQLGVKLKLNHQIVNTNLSGGYVSLWKAYQPVISSVQAGSIYHYTIEEGSIDVNRIYELIDKGVGSRRNEGFGRLIILPDWPYKKLLESKDEEQQKSSIEIRSFEEDPEQLNLLVKSLFQLKVIEEIREQVQEWKQNLKGHQSVNSSQWGKLLQITSELLNLPNREQTVDVYKKRWKDFWKELKDNLSNKPTSGLYSPRINDKNLEDFIMELIERKWLTKLPFAQGSKINHTYWSMRAFELLLRQIIRGLAIVDEEVEAK